MGPIGDPIWRQARSEYVARLNLRRRALQFLQLSAGISSGHGTRLLSACAAVACAGGGLACSRIDFLLWLVGLSLCTLIAGFHFAQLLVGSADWR